MFVFVLNLHSFFSNLLQILEKTIKNMIFVFRVLKFPILFYKIRIKGYEKSNKLTKKWKRLLKEDFMEKGFWNRKRVYSIRKFAVGACSVMIGTCTVLF